jgi:hypothetical protein
MEHHESSHELKRKKLPFCWQEKEKLRMIENIFTENAGLGSPESARSIYMALTEIASDFERDDNLEISQEAIARRACVCRATVNRVLPVFERVGLIKVKRNSVNGIKTQSTYTLVRGKIPMSNKRTTLSEATGKGCYSKKEYSEEASERSVSKTSKCVRNTCDNSLAGERDGFNKENGEYEW